MPTGPGFLNARSALLLSVAIALLSPSTAFAACANSGSGTVTSPNAGDEITCTGTDSNLDIIISAAGVEVTLDTGATVTDSNITFFGPSQGVVTLESGSLISAPTGTVRAILIADTQVNVNSGATVTGDRWGIASSSNDAAIVNVAGTVSGSDEAIFFGGGDDELTLLTGATLIGTGIRGGAGSDGLTLDGAGTLSLPALEFESLTKSGTGTWALTSTFDAGMALNVNAGELILRRDATDLLASSTATLAAGSTLSVDTLVQSAFADDASITGAGGITKLGLGLLTIAAPTTGVRDFTGTIDVRAGQLEVLDTSLYDNAYDIANGAFVDLQSAGAHAGDISGGGDLIISSAISLTGNNTFTGGITLNNNLGITSVNSLGTGSIDFNGDTNLTINIGSDQTMSNALRRLSAGAIGLTKRGLGNLTYSRNSSGFDGAIAIDDGRLTLGTSTSSLGTGDVINNGEFSILGNVANAISGTGSVIKEGGNNTALLLGNNTYSGGTIINEGAIIGGLTSFGSGALTLNNQGVVIFDTDVDGTWSNDVSGGGSLTKRGAGNVTMDGAVNISRINISEGDVRASADTYNAGLTEIGANSALELFGTGELSGSIRGDGNLRKTGAGRTAISAVTQLMGDILVDAGTLALGSRLVGDANINAGATLEFTNDLAANVAQTISGAGALLKTGSGDLSFGLGSAMYSGGTSITQGTVTSSDALGTGSVTISSSGTWQRSISGSQAMTNELLGDGEFVTISNGTLTIDSANESFNGVATLNGATVVLEHAAALGGADISSRGLLVLNGIDLANSFSGNGLIRKIGSTDSTLSGTNTHTGGIDIQTGNLFASSSALGTGAVTVAADATLGFTQTSDAISNTIVGGGRVFVNSGQSIQLNGANDIAELDVLGSASVNAASAAASNIIGSGADLTFRDDVSASGIGLAGAADSSLFKAGLGTLSLTVDSSLGNVTVAEGQLDIDANINTSGVSVATNAVLGGSGQITGDVTVSGTLAPGNSIGTLAIDGNYIQQAGSTLEIEFDNTQAIDLLQVTGSADIQGGELRLTPLTADADGVGLTFLTATNGVSGEFDSVTLDGGTGIAVYDPTALSIGENLSMIVLGARPTTINSQMAVSSQGAVGVLEAIGGPTLVNDERVAWGYVVGASDERDRQGQVLGYNTDTLGAGAGIRVPLSEQLYVGVAFTDADGEAELDRGAGSTDVDGTYVTAFTGGSVNQLAWQAGLLVGQQNWDAQRVVEFDGELETLTSATDADVIAAYGKLALPSSFGSWQLRPELSLTYVNVESDRVVERGNNLLALDIPSLEAETGYARLAVSGHRLFALNADTRVKPHWYAGIERAFPLDNREVAARFLNAALSDPITLDGDAKARSQLVVGGQLEVSLGERTALTFAYDVTSGEGETRQAARAGLKVNF
ncbi:MAG: autotransporter domain-containing protein [Pseudomonadaceae bacterium]|nr:autotransporter domain-containing protein [Pseudomonadaceae bacterium]